MCGYTVTLVTVAPTDDFVPWPPQLVDLKQKGSVRRHHGKRTLSETDTAKRLMTKRDIEKKAFA